MVQTYYNSKDAARVLGVSEEDVKKMLESHELHGYRDGADWKFKKEDIDAKVTEREPSQGDADDAGGDVLLSEQELGQSDAGTSGTVISMNWADPAPADSDIQLASSDLKLSGDSKKLSGDSKKLESDSKAPGTAKKGDSGSGISASKFEELDLTLADEPPPEAKRSGSSGKLARTGAGPGASDIDLASEPADHELVLGGGSSDLTIGGDSGISLISPSDTGLSLESPVAGSSGTSDTGLMLLSPSLDLGGAGEESVELSDDDLLVGVDTGKKAAGAVKTDDEFLLTPMDEMSDTQESASGSQVIALDTDTDEGGLFGGVAGGEGSMAAMLDEDLTTQPVGEGGMMATGLSAAPGALAEGAGYGEPLIGLPEAPYTRGQIILLATCAVLLMLCGMITYDLMKSMWSWQEPYSINSSLMDTIIGLFEGK